MSPLLVILIVSLVVNGLLGAGLAIALNAGGLYRSQYASSRETTANLQSQLQQAQDQNSYLRDEVNALKSKNAHPTLTIWTDCAGACTMTPGSPRVGGVPDTFTYNAVFTSDVPVGVYFFTVSQFVQYSNCGYSLSCVSGTYWSFSPTKSLNGVFHLAEGCASYLSVYYSDSGGTMYPAVSVTYNPAQSSTGACA